MKGFSQIFMFMGRRRAEFSSELGIDVGLSLQRFAFLVLGLERGQTSV